MDHRPTVELLESTHLFPGVYKIKAIGRADDDFESRVVEAVCSHLPARSDLDYYGPLHPRRPARGLTLDITVQTAEQVRAIYAEIRELDGLTLLFLSDRPMSDLASIATMDRRLAGRRPPRRGPSRRRVPGPGGRRRPGHRDGLRPGGVRAQGRERGEGAGAAELRPRPAADPAGQGPRGSERLGAADLASRPRMAWRLWPGPATLIFARNMADGLYSRLPAEVKPLISPDGDVALRSPAQPLVRDVLQLLPAPLVITMVATPEHPVPTTAESLRGLPASTW